MVNGAHVQDLDLLVRAEGACFRRPEFVETLVTYDLAPPPTLERLLASIAPPGSAWRLRALTVLNEIRRKWTDLEAPKGRKRALTLIDVSYVVSAQWHFPDESAQRELGQRVVSAGPALYLGLKEFPARITILDGAIPRSALHDCPSVDLGWMIYANKDRANPHPRYFNPVLVGGRLDLSPDAVGSIVS